MENALYQRTDQPRGVTQEVVRLLEASRAENTKKAYRKDWKAFEAYCRAHGVSALPATTTTIANYVGHMAGSYKPTTIHRHLMSISVAHRASGFQSPVTSELVRSALQGVRRTKGTEKNRKSALRAHHLRQIVQMLANDLRGKRDRALLLIGYAGAFRRSELCAIRCADVQFVEEGVRILVRHSKSDQESKGLLKDIGDGTPPSCPVQCLLAWLTSAGIESGPIFRSIDRFGNISSDALSAQSVSLIVKSSVKLLGMDPLAYGGHSLRAGFVTDAIAQGVQTQVIKQVTGHKYEGSLSDYFRESNTFGYSLNSRLGL